MKKDDAPIDYASPDVIRDRRPLVNRKRLGITVLVVLVAFGIYYPFSPASVQRRGLRAAEDFQKRVEPTIAADPRFSAVTMGVLTNQTLRVDGEVPNDIALHDLQKILVLPTGAPFRIAMRVTVAKGATTGTGE